MTDHEERAKEIFRRMLKEALNYAERMTMLIQEAEQKKIPTLSDKECIKLIDEFVGELKKKIENGEIPQMMFDLCEAYVSGFISCAMKKKDEKIEVA